MNSKHILLGAALACAAPAASAQYLLGQNSTTKKIMLLDGFDGHLIDADYIDLVPHGAMLPIDVIQVNNEIWVSDQNADKIMRFSLDGTTHLSDIATGLDNIRGMEFVNGEVYVCNAGSNNGAPGAAVVRFTPAGVNLGSFPAPSVFDVLGFQGGLLLNNTSAHDLVRYSYSGTNLGIFHDSTAVNGIYFPMQMVLRSNGNVIVAGYITPEGAYEYDPTGVELNFWPLPTDIRGINELGNGLLIFADNTGFHSLDPVTGARLPLVTGFTARYVNKFTGANAGSFTAFCAGDGSGTACPCANNSAVGANEGCLSSLGTGGKLTGSGNASLASDTVSLNGTMMPSSSALYFQGTTQLAGGAGVIFGDGLRCVGGSIVRLKTVTNVAGASQYPQPGDASVSVRGAVVAAGTRTYQVWYRNAASFCSAATFNLTNGLEVNWVP